MGVQTRLALFSTFSKLGTMGSTAISVLISGQGTNLQALIDACHEKRISNATIVRVISNREKAYGLQRAKNANIPTAYHNLQRYSKQHPDESPTKIREGYDKILADIVLADKPGLVICAGFMHILSPEFLTPLAVAQVPIINLHPALPGAFNGINAIERAHQAFLAGEITRTGVMIHYVISEVDMGEPLLVKEVPLIENETLNELEQRIHVIEWKAIVEGAQIAINRSIERHAE